MSIKQEIKAADSYDLLTWRNQLIEDGVTEPEERTLYAHITDELEARGLLRWDEAREVYVAEVA